MKKTDIPSVIINGDNNTVNFGEKKSRTSAAIIIAAGLVVGAAVLAVSRCCPELFTDFIHWIITTACNN